MFFLVEEIVRSENSMFSLYSTVLLIKKTSDLSYYDDFKRRKLRLKKQQHESNIANKTLDTKQVTKMKTLIA